MINELCFQGIGHNDFKSFFDAENSLFFKQIGELKIRELREKAKNQLGETFDIRAFHEVILGEGTVTLPILEEQVNRYITKAKEALKN